MFAFTSRGLAVLLAVLSQVGASTLSSRQSGNAIRKPGLGEIVPAGKPYTITWEPTTPGTVSLYLLRGPSTNIKKIATIVEKTPNTGTFEWTPDLSLEGDVTHYGINLTVDGSTGYQYSTQFGISNPGGKSETSTSTVGPTDSTTVMTTSTSVDAVGVSTTTVESSSKSTSESSSATGSAAAKPSTTSSQPTGSLTRSPSPSPSAPVGGADALDVNLTPALIGLVALLL